MEVPASPMGGVRPAKVIGLRRKTKREGMILKQLDVNGLLGPQHSIVSTRKKDPFNPFRKSTYKISTLETSSKCQDEDVYEGRLSGKFSSTMPAVLDESANMDPLTSPREKKITESPTYAVLPLDWSLKTKIRFASSKPFPWRGCLKTCEEASGTTSFARCLQAHSGNPECSVDSSANARFHQNCLTWMHPAIPWIKLFPRMASENNTEPIKTSKSSLFLNDRELQESLHADWCESLRSLYQLLRAHQCSFFYICAPTFTALFRAAGVGGFSNTQVLMTPTTGGLRQALKDEGINFTMPLNGEFVPINSNTFEKSVENSDREKATLDDANGELIEKTKEGEDSAVNEDEADESCLQSLGLSQDDFPSFNPKRRKLDQLKSETLDGRPKSLILIEGNDIQALVNFFLHSRHCIAITGPLAGIPPTLLSPCAFSGASMRSLKVRQGWVKHKNEDMHCIEISGPIMINHLNGLCSLFSNTQEGQFDVMLANHQPTVSFSWVGSPNNSFTHPAFATANLKDSGLSNTLLNEICKTTETPKGALTEITLKNYLYSSKFV